MTQVLHRPGKVLEFDHGPGKFLEFQNSAICPGIVLEFGKIALENVKLSLKIIKYTDSFLFFRVATVREKSLENEFFPGQGKVREFQFQLGKFRQLVKVREKSGNLRIFKKVHC